MDKYITGTLFTIAGVILAVFFKEPHFYTFFSIGLFLIFLEIYKHIVHHGLFTKWPIHKYVLFWCALLVVSVIIDIVGMKLGYWHYPGYNNGYDEIFKYVFEWCIALMYVTLGFFIGVAILRKHGVSRILSMVISLVAFVIPIGFVTEYFNHMANSWVITGMPITNIEINGYFIVFQTIGYWIMALISWIIYKLVAPRNKTP